MKFAATTPFSLPPNFWTTNRVLAELLKLGLKVHGNPNFNAKNQVFVYTVTQVAVLRTELKRNVLKLSQALGVRVVNLKKLLEQAVESQNMYLLIQVTKPACLFVLRAPNRTDEEEKTKGPPFDIFSQVKFFCGGMSFSSKAGFSPDVENFPLAPLDTTKVVRRNVGDLSANSLHSIAPDPTGFQPGTPSKPRPPVLKRKAPESQKKKAGGTNKKLKQKLFF